MNERTNEWMNERTNEKEMRMKYWEDSGGDHSVISSFQGNKTPAMAILYFPNY